MTNGEKDIIESAIAWFQKKRPKDYSADAHFRNPLINTRGEAEAQLATDVAKYLRADLEMRRDHDL
jgi:hypothetical protein